MSNRTSIRDRMPSYFEEKREFLSLSALHHWLLVLACVMIFLVLPLLFVWSSVGMIHPPASLDKLSTPNSLMQDDKASLAKQQLR